MASLLSDYYFYYDPSLDPLVSCPVICSAVPTVRIYTAPGDLSSFRRLRLHFQLQLHLQIPLSTLHFSRFSLFPLYAFSLLRFFPSNAFPSFTLFPLSTLILQLKAKILGDVALVLAVGHFPKLAVFLCLCFGRHGFVSACALNILQRNTILYLYN